MFTINQNLIDDFADKINEKEKKSNKVTSLSSESTDTEYPSAKAVHDNISSATTAINNRITNLNEGNINIAGAPYTQLGGTTATSLATLLHNIDNNFGDILFCAYNVGGTADAFTISGTGGFGNLTSNHPFILLAYNNVADSNAGATLTINNTMNPVTIVNNRMGGSASCAWKQGEWGIFFIYNGSARLLGSFSDTEYYQGMEFVTSTNTQNADTSLTGVTHKLNNLKDGTIFFYQLPNLRFTSESTIFVLTLRNNISMSGTLKENNVSQSLNQLSPNDILILQYSTNPAAYNIIGKIKANTFTEKKDTALQLLCNAIFPYRIFTVHTVKKEDRRTTYLLTYDGVPYAANEILYVYVPTYEFTRNTKPILSWENANMPSGSGMYIYPINSGTALYENDLNGYYLKIQYRNYRWELLEKTNNIVEATTEHAGLLSASDKIKLNNLHTVATSGSYNDLSNKPTIPTATSDLTNDSGFLTSHQSLDSKTVTVEEQSQAETGFTKTYIIKQGGVQVGNKINIPKDFLVKSASVKTVSTANNPIQGYVAGDKYLDFVVNSKDNTATDEHLYVLVSELVDTEIDWANVQNKPTFFDGNYNSLTNKPTIPTDVSDLTDTTNKQFTPKSHTHTKSQITDFPTIPDVSGKEDSSNKVSSWSSTTTDTHYPSEKLVKDSLDGKQEELVSGTNLKTLNGVDLLGEGDIAIDVNCGGSTVIFEDDCSSVSGLSNYGSSVLIRGTNAIATISYDSTNNCYALTGSGNYHSVIPIPVLNDKDNYSIEADFKCGYDNELNTIGFVVRDYNDTSIQSTSFQLKGNGKFRKMNYTIGSDKDYTDEIISYSPYTYWVHMRLKITGASVKVELSYDGTIFKTYNYTTETITNRQVGLFLFCERGSTNSKCWVKNIKAEYLCDSSTIIFEDSGVTGTKNDDFVFDSNTNYCQVTTDTNGTVFLYTTSGQGDYIPNIDIHNYTNLEITWTFTYGTRYACQVCLLNSNKDVSIERWYNGGTSTPTNKWYIPNGTTTVTNTLTSGDTMKLVKENDTFSFYHNDELISSTTPNYDVYYIGFTSADNNRPFGYKDLKIIDTSGGSEYNGISESLNEGSENTIYLGDDIMTMIDTALGHMITNWEDYE